MSENLQPSFGPVDKLEKLLNNKGAKVGVIGLGYVGAPLAKEYAHQGYDTVGYDLDERKVRSVNDDGANLEEAYSSRNHDKHSFGFLSARSNYDNAADIDVWYICVPTPVTVHKDPDTSYIESAANAIATSIRPGQLVILKSTTYPETTDRIVRPIIEEVALMRKMVLGQDWYLAFSPERIDPGNKQFKTSNTPVVVGGVTSTCTRLASLAMSKIVEKVHQVSSPRVAEMEKLLENIYRSVNIALVNELARLCDRMGGVSMWEVVEAAATKPFGFMPFYPGPGLGGHCIPVDPYYLSWMARRYDFETSFITLSARTNEEMPFYVVDGVIRVLASLGVRKSEAKILVLGVAFKRDVDDVRHSPAEKIMGLLYNAGFTNIEYSDPHVDTMLYETKDGSQTKESKKLDETLLDESDLVLLLTDHSDYPYPLIAERARKIVDTRNAFGDRALDGNNIVLLGGGDF